MSLATSEKEIFPTSGSSSYKASVQWRRELSQQRDQIGAELTELHARFSISLGWNFVAEAWSAWRRPVSILFRRGFHIRAKDDFELLAKRVSTCPNAFHLIVCERSLDPRVGIEQRFVERPAWKAAAQLVASSFPLPPGSFLRLPRLECPLNLRFGINEKIRARDHPFAFLQAAADFIVSLS